jgi:hypothetical protein
MRRFLILEYNDFDPFSHLKTKQTEEQPDNKTKDVCLLNIATTGNAKIAHPYLSLPAGYTCPFAKDCKSRVQDDKETGRPKLRTFGDYTCYAANQEKTFPNTRKRNMSNFDLLKTCKGVDEMVSLIKRSIVYYFPFGVPVFRLHESGDFFSQDYFDAWVEVANEMPNTIFYTYTKSLKFWVNRINVIPSNLKLNASVGGANDELIKKYNLKYVEVVKNIEEAKEKRLMVDINDDLAWKQDKSYAILLHGGQSAASGLNKYVKQNKEIINKLKGH